MLSSLVEQHCEHFGLNAKSIANLVFSKLQSKPVRTLSGVDERKIAEKS